MSVGLIIASAVNNPLSSRKLKVFNALTFISSAYVLTWCRVNVFTWCRLNVFTWCRVNVFVNDHPQQLGIHPPNGLILQSYRFCLVFKMSIITFSMYLHQGQERFKQANHKTECPYLSYIVRIIAARNTRFIYSVDDALLTIFPNDFPREVTNRWFDTVMICYNT